MSIIADVELMTDRVPQYSMLVGLPVNLVWRLLSVQNTAARLISDIAALNTVDALTSLHWLRVPECILFKVAVQTHLSSSEWQLQCSGVPVVLLHLSRWCAISIETPIIHQLIVPSYNLTTVGKQALPVFAANLWNSLPACTSCISTVAYVFLAAS